MYPRDRKLACVWPISYFYLCISPESTTGNAITKNQFNNNSTGSERKRSCFIHLHSIMPEVCGGGHGVLLNSIPKLEDRRKEKHEET